jgi:hypothetical protein
MATLQITVPDAVVPRIRAAFGKLRGLVDGNGDPRDATVAEVEAEVKAYLKGIVLDVEGRVLKDAVVVPDTGL